MSATAAAATAAAIARGNVKGAEGLKRLVVVVGATGVGKTKLGVELAKALNGEVVNADAMQMYKGLDIASAKPSEPEMEGIPHHLLGFLDPSTPFTVRSFRDAALPVIQDISARGKLPIVVGGTLYYIQSLLWPSLMDETPVGTARPVVRPATGANNDAEEVNTRELYARLVALDAETAQRIHPLDTRKIERQLAIFDEMGLKPSDLVAKQREAGLRDQLRFHCNVLWLSCDPDVHASRLARRAQGMLANGLLQEAASFINAFKLDVDATAGTKPSTPDGLFQAIGFREFLPIFKRDPQAALKGTVDRSDPLLADCTEQLLLRHRQYTRQQLKWIRSRLVTRNAPVHNLDTSFCDGSKENWKRDVLEPAIKLCTWFSGSDSLENDPPSLPRCNTEAKQRTLTSHTCDACEVTVVGDVQWAAHLGSRRHRKRLCSFERAEKRQRSSADTDSKLWHELIRMQEQDDSVTDKELGSESAKGVGESTSALGAPCSPVAGLSDKR